MYFSMVDFRTLYPSFNSSPSIRGKPQVGFSVDIRRIKLRISIGTLGRPCFPFRLFIHQKSLKPFRCTGDFNGDGNEDIGFRYGGDGNIWLGLSDGANISWNFTGTGWGWIVTDPEAPQYTGDFDGDGRTDIGFWYKYDGNIWQGLSNGSQIGFVLGGNR